MGCASEPDPSRTSVKQLILYEIIANGAYDITEFKLYDSSDSLINDAVACATAGGDGIQLVVGDRGLDEIWLTDNYESSSSDYDVYDCLDELTDDAYDNNNHEFPNIYSTFDCTLSDNGCKVEVPFADNIQYNFAYHDFILKESLTSGGGYIVLKGVR
jgi:hypothetical protein